MTPKERRLLRQATQIAEQGKREAATKLFQELVTESPELTDAWLGLAYVAQDEQTRRQMYEKVLTLDPDNEPALAGLAGEPVVLPSLGGVASASTVSAPLPQLDPIPPEPVQAVEPVVTGLSCNRCGKPLDPNDAVHVDTGYRCKECLREIEAGYYSATPFHYLIAVLIALPLGLLAGVIAPMFGFFVIFLAAGAGTLIGTLVFRAVSRNRGRFLPMTVAVCVAAGGLLPAVSFVAVLMLGVGLPGIGGFNIWSLIYSAIAASSAFYRLK